MRSRSAALTGMCSKNARASAIDPFNWLFAVGFMLILAVRYAPQGLVGLVEALALRAGWRKSGA